MGLYRSSIETIRHEAMQAAKDLGYSKDYINDLKAAKNEREIDRIMVRARHERFKD